MHDETLAAGPELVGEEYFERTRSAKKSGRGDSPELAAGLVSFLVSDQSIGITGKLLSARWDPWQEPVLPREAPPGQGPGDASSDR